MHLFRSLPSCGLLVSLICLLSPHSIHGAVIFQENFTNTTAGSTALSTIGWSGVAGSASTYGVVNGGATLLTNAQGDGRDQTPGVLYPTGFLNVARTGSGGVSPVNAVFTSITPTSFTGSTIAWITNTNANVGVMEERLLVQSGGLWYASAQIYTPQNNRTAPQLTTDSVSSPANVVKSFNFDPTAANWLSTSLGVSTTSLTLGSTPGADLSATITGIGFWTNNLAGTVDVLRFDTLQVTSVPEPSAMALALAGIALLGVPRRRSTCGRAE